MESSWQCDFMLFYMYKNCICKRANEVMVFGWGSMERLSLVVVMVEIWYDIQSSSFPFKMSYNGLFVVRDDYS